MEFSLGYITNVINGKLTGSADTVIRGIAEIDIAGPEEITFAVDRYDFMHLDREAVCRAGAVIAPETCSSERTNIIRVETLQLAIARVADLFSYKDQHEAGISSLAVVNETARLGKGIHIASFASVGANAVLGDRVVIQSGVHIADGVIIGADTVIHSNVVILSRTRIGKRVVIQPGAVIGLEGFGFVATEKETLFRIKHLGRVVLEDDVEIGACSTIERANLGQTILYKGVKTGSHVHIGHNACIGRNTRITTQAGIAGNTDIGENAVIGPQAGIAEGVMIGSCATVGPQAGVIRDLPPCGDAYGTPGMSRMAWLRSASVIQQLSAIKSDVAQLSRKIEKAG